MEYGMMGPILGPGAPKLLPNRILVCSDGTRFEVNPMALDCSVVLTECFEHSAPPDAPIPLPEVDGPTCQLVLDFCHLYMWWPEYSPVSEATWDVCPKSQDTRLPFFQKLSKQQFEQLISAANYLNIPRLIDYSCFYLQYLLRHPSLLAVSRREPEEGRTVCVHPYTRSPPPQEHHEFIDIWAPAVDDDDDDDDDVYSDDNEEEGQGGEDQVLLQAEPDDSQDSINDESNAPSTPPPSPPYIIEWSGGESEEEEFIICDDAVSDM